MHLGIAFGIAALLLLLPDAYIIFGVMHNAPLWAKVLLMLPALLYFLVLAYAFASGNTTQLVLNLVFWLTLCILFPTVIFTLLSLAGRLVGLLWHGAPALFDAAAVAAACIWLGGALYGISAGWKRVTVDRQRLAFSSLPASFDGYKIVHLSDFHIGTYAASPQTVKRIVDEVNALDPDIIVFTGDIVNTSAAEIDPFIGELSRLKAADGVVSVLGNHDYCLYRRYEFPDTPEKESAKVAAREREAGWRLLLNENVRIPRGADTIAIVGVENAGSKSFPDRSDLRQALNGVAEDEFAVLLSHDPSHWRREVLPSTDIALTLSGHTHAMQFRIGGFSPAGWAYSEWGGVYREGERTLVVSTGTGGNIAFRFGVYPQIVAITLERPDRD